MYNWNEAIERLNVVLSDYKASDRGLAALLDALAVSTAHKQDPSISLRRLLPKAELRKKQPSSKRRKRAVNEEEVEPEDDENEGDASVEDQSPTSTALCLVMNSSDISLLLATGPPKDLL